MEKPKPVNYLDMAVHWFGAQSKDLDKTARTVLSMAGKRRAIAGNPNQRIDEGATFGERLADRVARFGGSWLFVILFGLALLVWAVLNTGALGNTAFDPYPYIFLNLMLSMLAAIQAPLIMMSQNRQSAKDRQMASYDYEVNLKAEVEIMALHEKMDALRTEQMMLLLAKQQEQIELLSRLVAQQAAPPR